MTPKDHAGGVPLDNRKDPSEMKGLFRTGKSSNNSLPDKVPFKPDLAKLRKLAKSINKEVPSARIKELE